MGEGVSLFFSLLLFPILSKYQNHQDHFLLSNYYLSDTWIGKHRRAVGGREERKQAYVPLQPWYNPLLHVVLSWRRRGPEERTGDGGLWGTCTAPSLVPYLLCLMFSSKFKISNSPTWKYKKLAGLTGQGAQALERHTRALCLQVHVPLLHQSPPLPSPLLPIAAHYC